MPTAIVTTETQRRLVEDALLRARARSAPARPGLLAAALCRLGKLAVLWRQRAAARAL